MDKDTKILVSVLILVILVLGGYVAGLSMQIIKLKVETIQYMETIMRCTDVLEQYDKLAEDAISFAGTRSN